MRLRGALLLVVALVAGCRRGRSVSRPRVDVRAWAAESGALASDGIFEVTIRAGAPLNAKLVLRDEKGNVLAPPIAFERVLGGRESRAIVPKRAWAPHVGPTLGHVTSGSRVVATVQLDPGSIVREVALTDLEIADALRAHGEPSRALASLDALRDAVSLPLAPLCDAIMADAAFDAGRTRLAEQLAARGLALAPSIAVKRRLLRTQVAALAEAREPYATPLAALHALRNNASDVLEAAYDAALELRLAELHDRNEGGARRAPAAAAELVRTAKEVPVTALAPLSAMLCRAGAHLQPPESTNALLLGERLARKDGRIADLAICIVRRGDAAFDAARLAEAEAAYAEAHVVLGDRPLIREQRETWFSSASSADARGDRKRAFSDALEAARWVDRLLAPERDLRARDAMLANLLGYYGMAARFGVRAGESTRAIAAGEWGKGRAFGLLLRGGATVDVDASSAWFQGGDESVAPSLDGLAETLDEREAAISYTLLGRNDSGVSEIAIGVVTRSASIARIVAAPNDLGARILDHGRAIERGDEAVARAAGRQLHAALIEPIRDRLEGIDRILISPHLRLHAVSFAALHDGSRWLVQQYAIARVPPLGFHRKRAAPMARAWVSALAPPHPPLPPLPGFEAIAADLVGRVSAKIDLRGRAVTPTRLLSALAISEALLYAGHARYDSAAPLRSALLLADEHGRSELRAVDVLRLGRTIDTVVLLGCETARLLDDEPAFSDDAIGLSRAFLAGGARQVVGAMWPVLDRDAEDFARALLAEPPADLATAVARAQRCIAEGRCAGRGISTWASYLVDLR